MLSNCLTISLLITISADFGQCAHCNGCGRIPRPKQRTTVDHAHTKQVDLQTRSASSLHVRRHAAVWSICSCGNRRLTSCIDGGTPTFPHVSSYPFQDVGEYPNSSAVSTHLLSVHLPLVRLRSVFVARFWPRNALLGVSMARRVLQTRDYAT